MPVGSARLRRQHHLRLRGEFYSRADTIAILDLYAELAEPVAAG
jgi:hypothetical protein